MVGAFAFLQLQAALHAAVLYSITIIINGTPDNALGAYLDGVTIIVNRNAQDAVGDTMNDGKIIINGNADDVL